jgi:endonuclease/exonuclease/phosphatase family metal-dependent hydrolase
MNNYMGVALAYKTSKYTAEEVNLCRLSDTKPWPRPPKPTGLRARAKAALAGNSSLARAWRALTNAQPPRDDWAYARGRFNSLVFARLRDTRTGGSFCVATYHMPCAYWAPAVMTIHCALAAQRTAALAAGVPFVLAGDFNVKPGDPQYALLTTGSLPADAGASAPAAPAWEPWRAEVAPPLRSAYAEAHGAEPAFTNCAGVRDEPLFVETLDYIFVSAGVQVLDADALPASKDGATEAYPTAQEPSDHVLLAATMRC